MFFHENASSWTRQMSFFYRNIHVRWASEEMSALRDQLQPGTSVNVDGQQTLLIISKLRWFREEHVK